MNNMPSIDKPKDVDSNKAPTPSSPSEGLTPPSHEEEKVKIINPDNDNDSTVAVPLSKQGIEVIATRKGFYGQRRVPKGETFSVASFADLGEWMICTDKEQEKKRQQFFKEKKKAKK